MRPIKSFGERIADALVEDGLLSPRQVDELLDKSVSTEGYVIRPSATAQNYIDLSKIDFEALKQKFEKGRKPPTWCVAV